MDNSPMTAPPKLEFVMDGVSVTMCQFVLIVSKAGMESLPILHGTTVFVLLLSVKVVAVNE
jgi:hypothetical protein